jgi:site-specific DNA-methyltransferase (adenine-specific)
VSLAMIPREPYDVEPTQAAAESDLGLHGRLVGNEYMPPRDLSYDQWQADGLVIQEIEKRVGFWLGDWARKGLELFGTLRWQQALRTHGHAYQTIKNASSTALKFPPHERVYEDLSFTHYVEVKALPKEEAHAQLAQAAADRLSAGDLRDRVRLRMVELKRSEVAALPVPRLDRDDIRLLVGDATALPLADGLVDGIVTSPPYALEKAYPNGDVAVADWFAFSSAWAKEAYRVAKPGARLAVNVPIDTNLGGYHPTSAMMTGAAIAAGWRYRTTIDSSSSPNIYAPAEHVIVFYKGDEWGLEAPADRPSDITHEDWLAWTNGVWRFAGETNPWEYHPAPFPLELPRRLLYLLFFPGDLVLDPFVGSGTVPVACHRAGRRCIGVDRSPAYIASTARRVEKELHAA